MGTLSPAQIRAGRAMLKWRRDDLAERAGISFVSIKNIETGKTDPRVSTAQAIQDAFEAAGLIFIERNQQSVDGAGSGIRFRDA